MYHQKEKTFLEFLNDGNRRILKFEMENFIDKNPLKGYSNYKHLMMILWSLSFHIKKIKSILLQSKLIAYLLMGS